MSDVAVHDDEISLTRARLEAANELSSLAETLSTVDDWHSALELLEEVRGLSQREASRVLDIPLHAVLKKWRTDEAAYLQGLIDSQ